MIQILGLRRFFSRKANKEISCDCFFEKHWRAKSVADLFKDLDIHLAKIPEDERYNIFYTLANCTERKREFSEQHVMPYDIDGISTKLVDSYIAVVCEVLGVNPNEIGIVFSGRGLHFLIGLKTPITSKNYFKENRHHYRAVVLKINKALENAGLKGSADSTCFDARRIFRLPGTLNKKENKEDAHAYLIKNKILPLDHDITKISEAPPRAEKRVTEKEISTADQRAVLAGCDFLKFARANPNDISEPQWYAALSILARLPEGEKLCHEFSAGYKFYDPGETDLKIEQALGASGPRTCENIQGIFPKCESCPNFQKVKSPISIKSEDHIATEHTGFHTLIPTGNSYKAIPNYEDLRKFFERQYLYRGLGGTGMCQVWNGTHYEYYENKFLDQFAQTHFKPKANNKMVTEFRALVLRTNLTSVEWFSESTKKKMNFANGTLDLTTLEFSPHSPNFGFRHVLPYNYDPEAKCPTFTKMLQKITNGDGDMQNVLLEFMGYALSNDRYWAHKALVLVGEGANGKSTFMNTLKALAGDGNYSSLMMLDISRSEYNRQLLDGKLFNVSEETPTKAMLDTSIFKNLTSGGHIQVRAPYKEPYQIKNKAKLIFSCNDLPQSEDTSRGFFRRLIIAPFDQTFNPGDKDYDPKIEEKLLGELSGIFNLAVRGYQRLCVQERFSDSKRISEAQDEYENEVDSIKYWKNETVVVYNNGGYEDHFSTISELYASYKQETERAGRRPVSKIDFSRKLKSLLDEDRFIRKRDENGRQERGVQGVGYYKN